MESWDKREDVEAEFPRDQWDWHPVKTPEEGRLVGARLAMVSGKITIGQARWFAPNDGVILVQKTASPPDRHDEKIRAATAQVQENNAKLEEMTSQIRGTRKRDNVLLAVIVFFAVAAGAAAYYLSTQ